MAPPARSAIAVVPTSRASRYLQQLCKHWSHKFAVTFDAAHGEIPLPLGHVELDAGDMALTVHCAAGSTEDLDRMQQVVASHLERFSFREGELEFRWQAA